MKNLNISLLLMLFCINLSAQSNLQFTSSCENISINACSDLEVTLTATAETDCATSSFLTFNFQIDENNDGSIEQTGSLSEASGIFPSGTHRIIYTVSDQCGSMATCEYLFTLEDTEPPVAGCLNGLATLLMPSSGVVALYASEAVNNTSMDNCSDVSDLVYSFSSDPNDILRTFDCNEICDGALELELWTTDENGNQSSCLFYLLVQDLNNVCCGPGPMPQIIVETEDGSDIESGELCINGNCANAMFPSSVFSWTLNWGDEISIRKTDNPLNGVTTFDLVLIMKHILGVQPLPTTLKEKAADANDSGTISTFDIIVLRRLILGLDQTFADGETWVFEPSSLTYEANWSSYFFVGAHKGDVNETATSMFDNNIISETRTTSTLTFFTANKFLQKGKNYSIPIFANDYNDMLGGQFALKFDQDKVEIIDVESGVLNSLQKENFGLTHLQDGKLFCSWSDAEVETLKSDEPIFYLSVTAKENVKLGNAIAIDATRLQPEIYQQKENSYEFFGIQLEMIEETNDELSIAPNPFTDFTNITFTNKKESSVELNIFDISGKRIISQNKNMESGKQQISIAANDLPAKGIYFYQIKTTNKIHSGKLILQ